MADVTLRAILTGDSAGAVRGFEETGAAADTSGGKLGKLGKDADETHGKLGSMFKDMGNWVSNMGLPFGNSISKIGEKLEGSGVKGTSAFQKLSSVGGIALAGLAVGVIGFGAESLEMADKFDEAQSQLQVAVKNSGGSLDAFKPKLDAAYNSMANLGFNSTETASALTPLVTATGSTSQALNYLQLAANLARLKHISLSDATSILTKTLAGSTRALTSLGLNLDIGSAKFSGIANATRALSQAQEKLKLIQEQVKSGALSGATAQTDLQGAQISVSNASYKLRMDQTTLATVMDELRKKTNGAAKAYGNTLPGEMDIAKAHLHNLGTEVGGWMEPKIQSLLHVGNEFLGWLIRCKPALITLGVIIGGPLTLAIAAFVANTIASMISGMADAVTSLFSFGSAAEATGEEASAAFGPIGIAVMAVVIIGTLLASHWKQISKLLEGVWHGIETIGIDVWDGIKHVFSDFLSFMKEWGPLIGAAMLAPMTGGLSLVLFAAVKYWHDIVSFFEGIPGDITSALSSLGHDMEDIATDAWHLFLDAVKLGIKGVEFYFIGFPKDVLHWLGDLGSLLLGAGEDLVHGLAKGIENGWHFIASALGSLGSHVKHYISDLWSWASPSKYFMGIGEDLMEGLAIGITNKTGRVTDAIGSVGAAIKLAPFTVPTAAASASAAALAGGSSTPQASNGFGTPVGAPGSEKNVSVTVNAQTNADPHAIAAEVGWIFKTAGV